MGIYSEYLDRQFSLEELLAERKKQLNRISQARGRDILVFAADLGKTAASILINYEDLLPIRDQLDNLTGRSLDLSTSQERRIFSECIRLVVDDAPPGMVVQPVNCSHRPPCG
jgi:hypothetical protein